MCGGAEVLVLMMCGFFCRAKEHYAAIRQRSFLCI